LLADGGAETHLSRTFPLTNNNKNVEAFVLPSIITCNLASLAIAALYYTWRDVYLVRQRRQKTTNLHERVAHMLWVAANRN